MKGMPLLLILMIWSGVRSQNFGPYEKSLSNTESLRSVANTIRSIDPADEDFSDLEPLIKKIGTARVVVLGEATHSHGTTSSAKARLVRFLHKRMGFDVLAWESGLLQAYAMNTALRHPNLTLSQAKSYLMAGGWASQEEVHPVFEYARESWRSGRPLEMAGFDAGKPHLTAGFFRRFFTSMAERSPILSISEPEWVLVERLTNRGYGFISSEMPAEEVRLRERAVLESLIRRIRENRVEMLTVFSEREIVVAERFAADALACEQLRYTRFKLGTGEWNRARDSFMADNFLWLLRHLYPNRKIIVWAATAHLIRNSTLIKNRDNVEWYTSAWEMGNHLHKTLEKDLYTIAFTSFAGESGDVFPEGYGVESRVGEIAAAPSGSFEEVAHQLNQPYLFVDLRSAPRDHWLRGEFVSISLGRAVNTASWAKVIDAFFFIDKAEPNRHLPKDH